MNYKFICLIENSREVETNKLPGSDKRIYEQTDGDYC